MTLFSKRSGIVVGVVAGLLILAIATLPIAAHFAMPEVRLVNAGDQTILDATVALPSGQVVFGSVSPGGMASGYYGARQATDGQYSYTLRLANGERVQGRCGDVRNSEYGKREILTLDLTEAVTCETTFKY